ncbi:unnamed protein product [Gongylonema pulchrum]|uniref:Thioredoxin domain-containing protein n=1 Tax=Gongylonema pulchrum TaxID=637853 RepID=A0A3P7Q137_9BILA|nr:unnamed protein product [Gongylonema pulchrum]
MKRERYDKFGTFDEPPPSHAYTHHPFEDIFGFAFGGFDTGNSFFQKHRISMRLFLHSLLERSHTQPFIIFAYSGYCQLCFRLEPIWRNVVEDLEPLGYGIGTVNAMTDGNLLEKLRISRLPSVVVVVEGRVIHYRGTMQPLSAKGLRIFARDVIPNTFLIKITNHDGLRRFVDQWKTFNRISVVIFGSKEDPRIRYMLMAMKYAKFARFAYVYLNDQSTDIVKMRQALNIVCFNCETILIFNDFPQISVVIFGSKEDPRIRYMLMAMKYAKFARFAYVYLNDQSTDIVKMRQALNIVCFNCETILIFNDFPQNGPVARDTVTSAKEFSMDKMGGLIENNRHLTLPRLTSQVYFDDLCPISSRSLRKLCVILAVTDSSSDSKHIALFRSFAHKHAEAYKKDRLQFAYIYVNKQREFMMPFLENLPQNERLALQVSFSTGPM